MSKVTRGITFFLTGGGSGGHTIPALSLLGAFYKQSKDLKWVCNYHYIGGRHGIERHLWDQFMERHRVHHEVSCMGKASFSYHAIFAGKFHRNASFKVHIREFFRFLGGCSQGFFILVKQKRLRQKALLFSTGGYVSLPIIFAGYLLGYEIWVHEQTSRAGLANRIASFLARKVFISFESSGVYFQKRKVILFGVSCEGHIL